MRRERTPVKITLPDGRTRRGWHEAWRHLVVWKELSPHPDEEWYWSHAHESEVEWEEAFARG